MVGTFTSISRGKESLYIQGLCTRYRGRPPRNRWDRSVAQPAENFREGASAIGTLPEEHWGVRCRARALRSLYHHFCLGWKPDMMQVVGVQRLIGLYFRSPAPLTFLVIY